MLSDIIHASKERDASENVVHEYEVLDKYSQPLSNVDQVTQEPNQLLGDYELTACPAYVPVAHGNQQDSSTRVESASSESKGQTTDDMTRDDQNNEVYEDVVVSSN